MQLEQVFAQAGAGVRFDWGPDGLAALGPHCGVLVVVDVLSFTTTVDVVVERGSSVRLTPWAPAQPYALRRPAAAVDVPADQELVMASPNGATLCAAAAEFEATVFAACLRNATAVAETAAAVAAGEPIGVIACGERWGVNLGASAGPGTLRPAVEDLLGAGAVIAGLLAAGAANPSPEALVAATAFRHTDVAAAVTNSASGRELAAAGNASDVALAVQTDCSSAVPVLHDGVLRG